MQIVIEIPKKWIKDMAREEFIKVDELCEVIQHGTPLNEYVDKAFDDLNKCKCGSSYIIINGETYRIDTGYAFEGIELFANYIKGTLSKEKWEE